MEMKFVSKNLRVRFLMKCMIFATLLFSSLIENGFAGSLLGRAGIMYTTTQNNFRDQQSAIGLVRMTNGFTVAQPASGSGSTHGASVYMDTCMSVSGAIDLRNTNTIILQSDLKLDNGVTLSSGGRIYGYDRALILNGDLTIPAGQILHIGGRIVIDGRGNRLILGSSSQLFVDMGSTLTLRNLVLLNILNNPGNPPVKCAAGGTAAYCSNLCLDNVELALADDFWFSSGQMFIHNDVAITGTSALVYYSCQPIFITSGAKLYFDVNTTFSFVPATFTDCPYSTFPTTTTNNFIKMADQTSQLYLNGCTMCTTATGCRLRTGTVLFDNKVNLKSNSGMSISLSNPLTDISNGGVAVNLTPNWISWAPDGRYIAVCNSSVPQILQVFGFNSNASPVLSPLWTIATSGSQNQACAFSPDEKYIALVSDTAAMQIYSFSPSTGPVLVGTAPAATSEGVAVAWSPDGRFVATAGINVFKLNGNGAPILVASISAGANDMEWSPDGRFIAGVAGGTLSVVGFNGVNALSLVGSVTVAGFNNAWGVTWSPDERFIAMTDYASPGGLAAFYFNGREAPTQVSNTAIGTNMQVDSWSPDGRFISVSNDPLATSPGFIQIFSFNGYTMPTQLGGNIATPGGNIDAPWSPDGRFIAVNNRDPSSGNPLLQVFKVNYVSTNPSPQALSQSIVFGNSVLGSSYDATVRGLSGAQMVLDGMLSYDCVS
jgi:Tol biopolymer transport system component